MFQYRSAREGRCAAHRVLNEAWGAADTFHSDTASPPAPAAPRHDRSARSACGVASFRFILRRQDQETMRLQIHRQPRAQQDPDPDRPSLQARFLDVCQDTPVALRDGTGTTVVAIPDIRSQISRRPTRDLGFVSATHPREVPEEQCTAPACGPRIRVSIPDTSRRERGNITRERNSAAANPTFRHYRSSCATAAAHSARLLTPLPTPYCDDLVPAAVLSC